MGESSKAQEVTKHFFSLSIFNGLLALIFTIPILIPSLCIATPPGEFGCIESMETSWPGTWLLVAYLVFIIVGVFGALAWGQVYQFKSSTGKTGVRKAMVWLQLITFEVGVLGATAMMAAIGYVGGDIIAHGGSSVLASQAVASNIIPPLSNDPSSVLNDMPPIIEAVFIGLSVLAQLIGYVNIFSLKSEGPNS